MCRYIEKCAQEPVDIEQCTQEHVNMQLHVCAHNV